MSYLNRILIDEESHFECDGVFEIETSEVISKQLFNLNVGHIIVAADKYYRKIFLDSLKTKNHYILTIIESERLECVQNERAEKVYSEGEPRMNDNSVILIANKSTGDDIEDFFDHINHNKILPNLEKTPQLLKLFYAPWDDDFSDFLLPGMIFRHTYHLSILSEDDEKYLALHQSGAYFKIGMNLMKDKINYALSVCFRKTYLRQGENVYEMNESDLWQEDDNLGGWIFRTNFEMFGTYISSWQDQIVTNYGEFLEKSIDQYKNEINRTSYNDNMYLSDFSDSE